MGKKYVCIHGHFYQPPRENPWLEAVETQESATPDHDWNERITRECYAMNARARIQNDRGQIVRLACNYSRMSFNFGPTLLAWMEERAHADYQRVIDADNAASQRFGGHGSAIAQAYNHSILPLCNPRDAATQIRWGIRDFVHRFGRRPEGMWLPEAAVNTSSLEAIAAQGIAFTILAPRQCGKIRDLTASDSRGEWHDPPGGVDPTRAYSCQLPSGKSIAIFFYDGPVSQAVAFEGLLNDGGRFANRILSAFNDSRQHDQIVHIATDGESYGHHHKHGEMALAAAFETIEGHPDIELINYAQYLELHPPTLECKIVENSSWSCVHGVERWRDNCGCNTGSQGWHQRWRGPLRDALDWLRDQVEPHCNQVGNSLFDDIWDARDHYIDVILSRTTPESQEQAIDEFLATHTPKATSDDDRSRALCLMELQRHAMLMYTSCAWFFDDIAGIESSQVLQYAGRVVQLAKSLFEIDLIDGFRDRLAQAVGNDPELPNGTSVYDARVTPAILDTQGVGAHYALSRVFDGRTERVYTFDASALATRRRSAGRARLLIGHARLRSRITREVAHVCYSVLHQGDHTATCEVRACDGGHSFTTAAVSIEDAFDRADFAEVTKLMERDFREPGADKGHGPYSVASLFRDEQHAMVRKILEPTLRQIDASYEQIYVQHAPLARFLRSLKLSVPRRIQFVGVFVLSHGIRHAIRDNPPDIGRARELAEEASREGIALDQTVVVYSVHQAMQRLAELPAADDIDPFTRVATLELMRDFGTFVRGLTFLIDIWPLQAAMVERVLPGIAAQQTKASDGDTEAQLWLDSLRVLGEIMRVEVPV